MEYITCPQFFDYKLKVKPDGNNVCWVHCLLLKF